MKNDVIDRLNRLWARCDIGMDAKTASECRNVMSAAEEIIQDMLSDEREGRCFCDVCVVYGGMWVGDTGGRYTRPFCFGCGAALGADGIARRNADTARVERVRAALDAIEPLTIDGHMVRDAIRAALDGGDGGE